MGVAGCGNLWRNIQRNIVLDQGKMDESDDFVLIDSFNGAVYTMERNLKSVEIQLHRIVTGKVD